MASEQYTSHAKPKLAKTVLARSQLFCGIIIIINHRAQLALGFLFRDGGDHAPENFIGCVLLALRLEIEVEQLAHALHR